MEATNEFIQPVPLLQIEAYKPESSHIYLTYQKYNFEEPVNKKTISFCCLFDSRHIAASTLTGKDLKATQIKVGDTFLKALGVNCYSFAAGRAPFRTGDDPVPGAFLLEDIRLSLLKAKNTNLLPGKTAASLITDLDFKNLLEESLKPKTELFSKVFFNKDLNSLSEEQQQLLLSFLTNGYQIPEGSEYISREVTDRLLQLDGLIKVYPNGSEKDLSECEFGRVFLAAFVNPKVDYHFMRYFKDGWYERVGNQIRKRPNMKAEIPFPENDDQMRDVFNSKANDSDLEEFQFVGYYLVPTTATLADKIGRKYILEHHKV